MERFQRPALPGLEERRDARAHPPAPRRLLLLLARRHEAGLQPHLPRVPDLEALPGRHGRRHLDLRLRREDGRERHGEPGPRHHPHVERRPDLLPLRPRREQAPEPLRLRPGLEGHPAADLLRRVRHQVPLARPQAHRLRERRPPLHLRPGRGENGARAGRHRRRRGLGPRRRGQGRPADHQLRDRAGRPAGPVRRPRRRLHGAGQARQHPQPDRDPGHPRALLQVVARRPDDRLHLRPERHRRDLAHGPGRGRRAPAADDRRRHLQVPDPLVARRDEDPLERQDAAARLRRRRLEGGHGRGHGRSGRDLPVRLVPRQPLDRLRQARDRGPDPGPPLLARLPEDRPGHGRLVQLRRALVQPGRQVPLLRLRPGLQSRLQLDRMEPRLPGHVPGLFRDPGQRHAVAFPPQERRGRGQARAGPRRQARRGRQEDRRQDRSPRARPPSRSIPTASWTASSPCPS